MTRPWILVCVFFLLTPCHANDNLMHERLDRLELLYKQQKQLNEAHEQDIRSLRERLQSVETSCGTPTENDRLAVKRSDDSLLLQTTVDNMAAKLAEASAKIDALQNAVSETRASAFTRWGHSACPAGTDLVYSGYLGGSLSTTPGAAANYLCLPLNPEFDDEKQPIENLAELYGGEYHTYGESTYMMDAVCAVCRPPRATVVMVPAATHCWSGWTLEYTGHLMAGRPDNAAASEFICVDTAQQARSASHDNENGKLLYYTATHCGSLPCPPYVNQKIVPCAVCTK